MTFGSDGFFGYSTCSSPHGKNDGIQWWSTYESASPPPRDLSPETIKTQLLERYKTWASPWDSEDGKVFERLIELGCRDAADDETNKVLVLPRYITPRIPSWTSSSGRVVLLGDAAHAMPPDSGQGVSCAAEDSVALGLLLRHFLVEEKCELHDGLKKTAKAYEVVRMKRVWGILDEAKRRGQAKKKQTWLQEKIRDMILWLVCEWCSSSSWGYYVDET
jgi:2-polyprenyl-6-methoxyphenol hydroxylase-like FAD-dependent oxidoreductase